MVNTPLQKSGKAQERLAGQTHTVCSWLLVDPFGMAVLSPGSSRVHLTSSSHFPAGQLVHLVQTRAQEVASHSTHAGDSTDAGWHITSAGLVPLGRGTHQAKFCRPPGGGVQVNLA